MIQHDGSLYVFGGFGIPPHGYTQIEAQFVKDWSGEWTNELHVFNLSKGEPCS